MEHSDNKVMVSDENFPVLKRKNLKLDIHKINSTYPKPKKLKKLSISPSKDQLSFGLEYAVSSKKGNSRKDMQDHYKVNSHPEFTSYGVYDGHHSSHASTFAADWLQYCLRSHNDTDIINAFQYTDTTYLNNFPESRSGTTASVLMVSDTHIISANVGDSPVLLVRENDFKVLSCNHNTENKSERSRIEKLGGFVLPVGKTLRVQGSLKLTRSIGDQPYKELLSPFPHIEVEERSSQDLFGVVSSDGLIEGMSYQEVADFVKNNRNKPLSEIAESLTDLALEKSRDNATVIIVDLKQNNKLMSTRNSARRFTF